MHVVERQLACGKAAAASMRATRGDRSCTHKQEAPASEVLRNVRRVQSERVMKGSTEVMRCGYVRTRAAFYQIALTEVNVSSALQSVTDLCTHPSDPFPRRFSVCFTVCRRP